MLRVLSEEQKDKIRYVQEKVALLQKQMDVCFEFLVQEIGFKEYSDAYHNSSDELVLSNNPIDPLFDAVYNSTADTIDEQLERIERSLNNYHENN